ncbi:IS110 family transposase [Mameliella sp.]|uniref:IS110 family transposase n=1 Tax=Mameliella sp. TaxID=1924940 RepID=UPI003BAD5CC7
MFSVDRPTPKSDATCFLLSPLVSAIRTASARNSSVRFSPIVSLLFCNKCYQRSGIKPRHVHCAFRAHLAEYGVTVPQGRHRVDALVAKLDELREDLPEDASFALDALVGQLNTLDQQIDRIDIRLADFHKTNSICRLLATIPGIGPITATAFAASIPDPSAFRSGREFAAWLELTPRQNSSAGKHRLGGITKQGDRYLRHLLVLGARTVVRYPKARSRVDGPWIEALLERRRPMVVAVAVANKLARTIWAMLSTGEVFRTAHP